MENFKRGGILFIGILLAVAAYNYFTQTINLSDLLPKKEKTPEATLFEQEKDIIANMVERNDAIKNWKSLLPNRHRKAFTLDVKRFTDTSSEESFLIWGILKDAKQYNDSLYVVTFEMTGLLPLRSICFELFCFEPKLDSLMDIMNRHLYPGYAIIAKFITADSPQFEVTSDPLFIDNDNRQGYLESEIVFGNPPPIVIYGYLIDYCPVWNIWKHVASSQKSLTKDPIETN